MLRSVIVLGLALSGVICLGPEGYPLRSDAGALGGSLLAAARDMGANRNLWRGGSLAGLLPADAGRAVIKSAAGLGRVILDSGREVLPVVFTPRPANVGPGGGLKILLVRPGGSEPAATDEAPAHGPPPGQAPSKPPTTPLMSPLATLRPAPGEAALDRVVGVSAAVRLLDTGAQPKHPASTL